MVLWSHVITAGVVGYFFLIREDEAVARLHDEDMRARASHARARRGAASRHAGAGRAALPLQHAGQRAAPVQDRSRSAHAMLEHLSRYLGAMLPRMRKTDSTLGHELALALAYLSVQKIRMGARLTIRTDVPDTLDLPFVSADDAGHARRERDPPRPDAPAERRRRSHPRARDRRQVARSGHRHGRRLSESSGPGVGLANVRARLSTLHGGKARFLLAQNPHGGVTATIELPTEAPRQRWQHDDDDRARANATPRASRCRASRSLPCIRRRPRFALAWGLANMLGWALGHDPSTSRRPPRTSSTNRSCRCSCSRSALSVADAFAGKTEQQSPRTRSPP